MMHVLAREANVGYIVCGNGFILASLSCAHASMICSRISCTAMHECAALFILSEMFFQPIPVRYNLFGQVHCQCVV